MSNRRTAIEQEWDALVSTLTELKEIVCYVKQ